MKVIERHEYRPKEWRFICPHCKSILQAKREELRATGSQYNETFYKFHCPVCDRDEGIGDTDITVVEVEN